MVQSVSSNCPDKPHFYTHKKLTNWVLLDSTDNQDVAEKLVMK